ncbi:MAG: tetratricopeptide repeat protein [Burkholderiales bacterium]
MISPKPKKPAYIIALQQFRGGGNCRKEDKLWLHYQAKTALFFGRQVRARDLYQALVQQFPADIHARICLGNLAAKTGDMSHAMAQFEAVVAIRPQDADTLFNLGYLHEQLQQYEMAQGYFEQAIAINSNHDRAWYGLGLARIRAGQLKSAIEALKENTRIQPMSPYGWYQLAMTYHHLGESSEAGKILKHLKNFEPKFAAQLERDLREASPQSSSVAGDGVHRTQVKAKETQPCNSQKDTTSTGARICA